MKFIQQAYKGDNNWLAYLVTIFLMFFGWQLIGIIPLVAVAFYHSEDMSEFAKAANENFMTLGINSNLFLILMISTFIFGLIFLFLGVKYIHKRNIITVITSRKKIDWSRVMFAFLVWAVIGLITFFIDYYTSPNDYVLNFQPLQFSILVLISFLLLPLQTSMEEVLFRGYLMQGFGISSINKKFWFVLLYLVFSIVSIVRINQLNELNFIHNSIILVGFGLVYFLMNYLGVLKSLFKTKFSLIMFNFFNRSFTPLFLTSVIFGLLHGANPEVEKLGWIMMIYYIGTGLLLGVLALMDEGIELSLGFHAANNIIAAVLVTSSWAAFQTEALFIDIAEPTVDFEFFLPFILFYPLVIFVFSKKYGWTNWKEKLFGTVRKPIEFDEDRFIA